MRRRVVACLLLLGACDIDAAVYPYPDGGLDASFIDAGPPTLASRGRFFVIEGAELHPAGPVAYAAVEGHITNGDLRPLYYIAATEGDCRLLTIDEPAFCQTVCDGVCIGPDVCIEAPRYLSAGSATIRGLLTSINLAQQTDNAYLAVGELPLDLFTSEAVVRLSASGDEISWFVLSAGGVRALVTDLPLTPLDLDTGGDVTITWADPDPSTIVHLELTATNAYVGQPAPAILDCQAMDAGSLTIPASLIAAMPRMEGSCVDADCPRARLRRQHSDSIIRSTVPIQLVVASEIRFSATHQPL